MRGAGARKGGGREVRLLSVPTTCQVATSSALPCRHQPGCVCCAAAQVLQVQSSVLHGSVCLHGPPAGGLGVQRVQWQPGVRQGTALWLCPRVVCTPDVLHTCICYATGPAASQLRPRSPLLLQRGGSNTCGGPLRVDALTAHRLMAVGCVVATKFFDDKAGFSPPHNAWLSWDTPPC